MEEAKLCECGCGQPAPIAKRTSTRKGHTKGQPMRYVLNHSLMVVNRKRRISKKAKPDHPQKASLKETNYSEWFWTRISKKDENECWEWKGGCKHKFGYGFITKDGKTHLAHREAFLLSGGVLTPEKNCVLHECDNPACCNPAHLFAGSRADNCRDRTAKGRGRTGDIGEKNYFAKLTEEQAREILRLCSEKVASHPQIAKMFGISRTTVSAIKTGATWAHLQT